MSDYFELIIKSIIGVIISAYFIDSIKKIYAWIISPMIRIFWFPLKRYLLLHKKPKIYVMKEVKNEFFHDWYNFVFHNFYSPSHKERIKELEEQEEFKERTKFKTWI